MSKYQPLRCIVLDPKLFDATGKSAPKLVELDASSAQADRDLAWDRWYDRKQREREFARDERE